MRDVKASYVDLGHNLAPRGAASGKWSSLSGSSVFPVAPLFISPWVDLRPSVLLEQVADQLQMYRFDNKEKWLKPLRHQSLIVSTQDSRCMGFI